MELRSDKCTAFCPQPGRCDGVRGEMKQFVKWTPQGLMILGTASGGEYRMEITTQGKKEQEPTRGRLQNSRILADKIKQLCEADVACRRLAPAWKLVTIVLNNALSFDCCVVPPEAMARTKGVQANGNAASKLREMLKTDRDTWTLNRRERDAAREKLPKPGVERYPVGQFHNEKQAGKLKAIIGRGSDAKGAL